MAYRCRKNQASLTATERSRFVAAVLALKASGKYEQYVQWHIDSMAGMNMWAHRHPAFLPWHRKFLNDYELDLLAIDAGVTLPYWDWTVDNSVSSTIWDASFMGGNGRPTDGRVMTGPFAYDAGAWTLVTDGPDLRRQFGVSASTLPTAADVAAAMAQTVYDAAPWTLSSTSGFRNMIEGWFPPGTQTHNRVHVWIGGSMFPASSPNDPVFFLHHCFIDKLWADWQAANPGAGYIPVSGGPAGHNLADSMEPWASAGITVTPASMLDHHALGYAYDTEGLCAISTLKFADDFQTLKFRDDGPTLKLIDDQPTLKFRDDIPTLKYFDDRPTLKLLDDQPTTKFRDDPQTLKFADDPSTLKTVDDGPGTHKAIDDAPGTLKVADERPGTLKTIDEGPGTLKSVDDVKTPGLERAGGGASDAPFILATPHHSMAWTQTFPQAFQSAVQQLEAQLSTCHAAILEREERERLGALTPAEAGELASLRQEFQSLLAEYEDMTTRGPSA